MDREDKSCFVAHNVCRSSVCYLLHVTHFLPVFLQWFVGFFKSCAPLRKEFLFTLGLNSHVTTVQQLAADSHVTVTVSGESKVTGAKYIQDKLKLFF